MKRSVICFGFMTLISCSSDRKFMASFNEKGCNIEAIRKQSELAFSKLEKSRKYRNRPFRTDVYENDTSIVVFHTPLNDTIRFGGGTVIEISKKDCKVTSAQTFQ